MRDINPWTNVARRAPISGDLVSLVEGSMFAISDASGDIAPGGALGLFHRDTRFLSRLELLVNGASPESLAARTVDPYSARFVLRPQWSGPGESPLIAVRSRFVGDGLHEDLDVTNYGEEPVELRVELLLDADFADLFEVKLGSSATAPKGRVTRRVHADEGLLAIEHGGGQATGIRVGGSPAELSRTRDRLGRMVADLEVLASADAARFTLRTAPVGPPRPRR